MVYDIIRTIIYIIVVIFIMLIFAHIFMAGSDQILIAQTVGQFEDLVRKIDATYSQQPLQFQTIRIGSIVHGVTLLQASETKCDPKKGNDDCVNAKDATGNPATFCQPQFGRCIRNDAEIKNTWSYCASQLREHMPEGTKALFYIDFCRDALPQCVSRDKAITTKIEGGNLGRCNEYKLEITTEKGVTKLNVKESKGICNIGDVGNWIIRGLKQGC